MQIHPAAEIFPALNDSELGTLAQDIKANGLRMPIVLLDGKILDGRNRWAACKIANVEAKTRDATKNESENPVAYVLSTNLHRRHLNESQRAMVGARALPLLAEQARERQGAPIELRANLPEAGRAREHAASGANVSPRSVEAAAKVIARAVPAVVKAVDAGKLAVSAAAELATRPHAQQVGVIAKLEAGKLKPQHVISELRREDRTEKLAAISRNEKPLNGIGRFPVIYADPPWRYEHSETESRAIENQYPTMDLDAICNLPVATVATMDAILFLWTTPPKLEEAMRVIAGWGFNYRTCAVWVKDKIGMGYYFRQQHELLLTAVCGNPPTPPPAARAPSVIAADRTKHSAKPAAVYEIIERMYPTLPKLELFSRAPRAGWTAWGNQA